LAQAFQSWGRGPAARNLPLLPMEPRSRQSRQVLATRDGVEKERLKHRTGGYFRYEEQRNPIDHAKGCPAHAHYRERMLPACAAEEVNHFEREQKKVHRDEVTEAKRATNYKREENRWRAISSMHNAADERMKRMVADPMVSRKNVSGQPYNIVSQEYNRTPAGAQLEHHDNMIRYRSKVREASLAMRNHLGFNPIIGEQTHGISLPPPPKPRPIAMGSTMGSSTIGSSRRHPMGYPSSERASTR